MNKRDEGGDARFRRNKGDIHSADLDEKVKGCDFWRKGCDFWMKGWKTGSIQCKAGWSMAIVWHDIVLHKELRSFSDTFGHFKKNPSEGLSIPFSAPSSRSPVISESPLGLRIYLSCFRVSASSIRTDRDQE